MLDSGIESYNSSQCYGRNVLRLKRDAERVWLSQQTSYPR